MGRKNAHIDIWGTTLLHSYSFARRKMARISETVVHISSHVEFVKMWLEKYLECVVVLRNLLMYRWNRVWEGFLDLQRLPFYIPQRRRVSDLIPGLPDDYVKRQIWPRIQASLKDVDPDRSKSSTIEHLRSLTTLAVVSKKWRFLVTTSRPWAILRLTDFTLRSEIPVDQNQSWVRKFQAIMKIIPPLDIFVNDDIVRLH